MAVCFIFPHSSSCVAYCLGTLVVETEYDDADLFVCAIMVAAAELLCGRLLDADGRASSSGLGSCLKVRADVA